jgi:tetratricopeptide (TPR) repeat protein
MDYQDYITRIEMASRLVQDRKFKEAVDALYPFLRSDLSDIDKALVCANLASIYDRMGSTEEALSYYDKGIEIEQTYCRYEVTEKKAHYLSQLGRSNEAVPIYEALFKQPYLTEAEKVRVRKNIQTLLGKTTSEWK